jgi:hypothetical protein
MFFGAFFTVECLRFFITYTFPFVTKSQKYMGISNSWAAYQRADLLPPPHTLRVTISPVPLSLVFTCVGLQDWESMPYVELYRLFRLLFRRDLNLLWFRRKELLSIVPWNALRRAVSFLITWKRCYWKWGVNESWVHWISPHMPICRRIVILLAFLRVTFCQKYAFLFSTILPPASVIRMRNEGHFCRTPHLSTVYFRIVNFVAGPRFWHWRKYLDV